MIDGEVRELAAQARGQHLVRALAHGAAPTAANARPRRRPTQNSSILRPTVAFSSSAVGAFGGEIAGGLLRLHLDLGVVGDQLVRDRHALADLDAGPGQRVVLHVRHRDEAVDAA